MNLLLFHQCISPHTRLDLISCRKKKKKSYLDVYYMLNNKSHRVFLVLKVVYYKDTYEALPSYIIIIKIDASHYRYFSPEKS